MAMNSMQAQIADLALQKLLNIFETRAEIARILGIRPQVVSEWFCQRRFVPPFRALQIEKITRNLIKASDLRPDLDFSIKEKF